LAKYLSHAVIFSFHKCLFYVHGQQENDMYLKLQIYILSTCVYCQGLVLILLMQLFTFSNNFINVCTV